MFLYTFIKFSWRRPLSRTCKVKMTFVFSVFGACCRAYFLIPAILMIHLKFPPFELILTSTCCITTLMKMKNAVFCPYSNENAVFCPYSNDAQTKIQREEISLSHEKSSFNRRDFPCRCNIFNRKFKHTLDPIIVIFFAQVTSLSGPPGPDEAYSSHLHHDYPTQSLPQRARSARIPPFPHALAWHLPKRQSIQWQEVASQR